MKTLSLRLILAAGLLIVASSCSTLDISSAPNVDASAQWAMLPFANHTETPLAGQRAETIAETLLRSAGIAKVKRYPASLAQESLFEPNDRKAQEEALAWARQTGAKYALTGAVYEWRYKVGVDGEPAVGVSLSIIDVLSGETLWSSTGGKSGWSREALAAVAQKLMRDLLNAGLAKKHH